MVDIRASAHPEFPVTSRRASLSARDWPDGFTLVELFLVLVMVGALAAMATPRLNAAVRAAANARAIGDIDAIAKDLYAHEVTHNGFPESLAEIGRGSLLDPWGHPYRYLRIRGAGGKNGKVSGVRKDRFLVPINSDFDLYSMGPDGLTQAPLTAAASADDIVRANDGGFVGPAVEY